MASGDLYKGSVKWQMNWRPLTTILVPVSLRHWISEDIFHPASKKWGPQVELAYGPIKSRYTPGIKSSVLVK